MDFAENRCEIDLGCGPNKMPGAYGVDIHPYPGVDQVVDLDSKNWSIPSNRFSRIYIRHLIEHVDDVRLFMNEVYRIGRCGAVVEITTPHFSSYNSYADPTHVRHLASTWHEAFTKNYLSSQVVGFTLVSSGVDFGRNLRCLIPKCMVRFKGVEWWEKHYAFVYPGRNVKTVLQIKKGGDSTDIQHGS